LTTPIGPPLLPMNSGEPDSREDAVTSSTGRFTEALAEPAQRLATRRQLPELLMYP
jgi:hypothetical protein